MRSAGEWVGLGILAPVALLAAVAGGAFSAASIAAISESWEHDFPLIWIAFHLAVIRISLAVPTCAWIGAAHVGKKEPWRVTLALACAVCLGVGVYVFMRPIM